MRRRRAMPAPAERPGLVFTEGMDVTLAEMEAAARGRLHTPDVPSWRDDPTYDLGRKRGSTNRKDSDDVSSVNR